MNQITLGLDPLHKKTRKEVFLEEMNKIVPWQALVALIQPHARGAHQALGGRPPFAVETMLRIHCLQLWWNLSDPAMDEDLHERPLYRRFVGLDGAARLPDESTILRFRHLLEKHQLAPQVLATINAGLAHQGLLLKTGTVVDATIIAAPSSHRVDADHRSSSRIQTAQSLAAPAGQVTVTVVGPRRSSMRMSGTGAGGSDGGKLTDTKTVLGSRAAAPTRTPARTTTPLGFISASRKQRRRRLALMP